MYIKHPTLPVNIWVDDNKIIAAQLAKQAAVSTEVINPAKAKKGKKSE